MAKIANCSVRKKSGGILQLQQQETTRAININKCVCWRLNYFPTIECLLTRKCKYSLLCPACTKDFPCIRNLETVFAMDDFLPISTNKTYDMTLKNVHKYGENKFGETYALALGRLQLDIYAYAAAKDIWSFVPPGGPDRHTPENGENETL